MWKEGVLQIRVPKRIQVGGHIYSIDYNDEIERKEHLWGTHDHHDLKIEIYPHISPTVKTSTLLHELLHAISVVYAQSKCDDDTIQSIAEGLTQVMSQIGITLDWGNIK